MHTKNAAVVLCTGVHHLKRTKSRSNAWRKSWSLS